MFITGNSEGSISNTIGSTGKSSGSSFLDLSTASFTSCKAVFIFTSELNSIKILELSCDEFELMFLIPSTVNTSFSIGLVTKFSISTGAFPG